MSDQLQADSVLQSFNAFTDPLGLKLSWPKTKLLNVGAGDPSTILVDGVRGLAPAGCGVLTPLKYVGGVSVCFGRPPPKKKKSLFH